MLVPVSPWVPPKVVPVFCKPSQVIADVSLPHERMVDAGKDTSPPPPPRPSTQPSPLVQPSPSPAPLDDYCKGTSPDYMKCCRTKDGCAAIWAPVLGALVALLGVIVAWRNTRPRPGPGPPTDMHESISSFSHNRATHVSVAVYLGRCCYIGGANNVGSRSSDDQMI